jgi:hypothetical protein
VVEVETGEAAHLEKAHHGKAAHPSAEGKRLAQVADPVPGPKESFLREIVGLCD